MLNKPYGKTGKDVSVIGFGGMRFSNPEDIDSNAQIVLHAYNNGINYFDTAPGYCQDKSEEIFAAAIKQMKSGTFFISSKSGRADGSEFRAQLENSLKLLGLEKIHFYHLWCVTTLENWQKRKDGGAVAAGLKAKEEGLIEHLTISSHLQGNELKGVLEEGYFDGVTLGYCAINFPYRQEAIDAAGQMGLGVVTMNPLGGGLIPKNAERFDFLREDNDKSVVEAALHFNISQPAVNTALVGFSSKQHVDEAVAAVENFQPYGEAHIASIRERITESFNGLCTGCGYCLPCPEGIPIPKLMDAYNFKVLNEGDENQITERLKWNWGLKPSMAQVCSLCGKCEEKCTQHLPICKRMEEIGDLADKEEKKD